LRLGAYLVRVGVGVRVRVRARVRVGDGAGVRAEAGRVLELPRVARRPDEFEQRLRLRLGLG
jgi:hypothetical protein